MIAKAFAMYLGRKDGNTARPLRTRPIETRSVRRAK
jgi:hypothetical protein